MSQGTLFSDTPKSGEISRSEAIAFRRVYSRRKRLALRIRESGCSSLPWQTPRAARGEYQRDNGDPEKQRDALAGEAAILQWSTPTTQNTTSDKAKYERPTAGPSRGGASFGLEDQALQQWCTPGGMEQRGRGE
jgi:hypothetical protein